MTKEIKVVELFAGVGGFRLGLEGWKGKSAISSYQKDFKSPFKVIWSNQYEPSTKIQHASRVYESRFKPTKKSRHINEDIFTYPVKKIPNHDMLVGGFPCQDYSVARTLNQAQGLVGKKGVLWWAIYRILKEKGRNRPSIVFLENVDRLLKSPVERRGRDFAIMLASLAELGYTVEWRVINAAEYGMPQRRRRVFLLAYRNKSNIDIELKKANSPEEWILVDGVFASQFPVVASGDTRALEIKGTPADISESFRASVLSAPNGKPWDLDRSPFENAGILIGRKVYTIKTKEDYHGPKTTLRDIVYLDRSHKIPEDFFLKPETEPVWQRLKGAKKDNNPRQSKSGHLYHYNEGPMSFPDPLEKPARTIITGEGGKTPSRFKHVIWDGERKRRLIPEELEKLNMFPPGHTELTDISDVKRAFFMGNALVVGVVEMIGRELANRLQSRL